MVPVQIKVEMLGDKRLEAMLRGWKPSVQRRITRPGISKGARLVSRAAKSLAPVQSGLLRKSIGVRVKTYKSGVVVGIVGPRKGFRQEVGKSAGRWTSTKGGVAKAKQNPIARIEMRDPAKYAHLVEFGTKAHAVGNGSQIAKTAKSSSGRTVRLAISGKQHGKNHPGARAKPFLEPAFTRMAPMVRQIMRDEIAKGVRREALRLVKRGIAA